MQPRALIVDDEAPAREELRFLIEGLGDLDGAGPVQVVGEATNGEEALLLLTSLDYDLVFLDIRMPGLTGLDVARKLRGQARRPQIIFTTAYPDHAVDAFDLAATDYLVKPFDAERFRRAVERALASGPERPAAEAPADQAQGQPSGQAAAVHPTSVQPTPMQPGQQVQQSRQVSPQVPPQTAAQAPSQAPRQTEPQLVRIPVQKDGRTVLVQGESIVYAAASRGYSSLKLADERVLVSFSLNELERRLHGHFCRVHRSYLVNLRYVRELAPDFRGTLVLVMNDRQRSRVEVSRRHARELRRRLGLRE